MRYLLKQIKIIDEYSSWHEKQADILIESGWVKAIESSLDEGNFGNDLEILSFPGASISHGWVDIFTDFAEPGYEHRESYPTGCRAALAGGFTSVFLIPNTNPVTSTGMTVERIQNISSQAPITFYPLGSVSKNAEGAELAEMYDMERCGAVAFTDGIYPIQQTALLLKALQYVAPIRKTIIQIPFDESFKPFGFINEGKISVSSGNPGIPYLSETIQLGRDISIAEYLGASIHFTGVSTQKGLSIIEAAKARGVGVTCSVTPHHLFFCDEDLEGYDTLLKYFPVLRSREDMMALRRGVEAGIVDCVSSHHRPQHTDDKDCEFETAKSGTASLQTCFSVTNTALENLTPQKTCSLFSMQPRKIFGLKQPIFSESILADFTIFRNEGISEPTIQKQKSKSPLVAYLNKKMKGSILGVFSKGKYYPQEA